MKPIIGVIGRPDILESGTLSMCLWENVRLAIVKKGGIPFLIAPNQNVNYNLHDPENVPKLTEQEKDELYYLTNICDGLIIPGGDKWYEYDEVLYKYALEKDMPILGICAGMQIIGKMDTDQDKPVKDITIRNDTLVNHKVRGQKYVHNVDIMDNTNLKDIVGDNRINVNSSHNYHIDKVNKLTISAYSEDGLIEAVEYSDKKFVLGVQWHPEAMLDYDAAANKIIDAFIRHCEEYKSSMNITRKRTKK